MKKQNIIKIIEDLEEIRKIHKSNLTSLDYELYTYIEVLKEQVKEK